VGYLAPLPPPLPRIAVVVGWICVVVAVVLLVLDYSNVGAHGYWY
jgi:hypothetical protein